MNPIVEKIIDLGRDWVDEALNEARINERGGYNPEPLYLAPQPQREWVELTVEEIHELVGDADLDWQNGWTLDENAQNRYLTLCRAIEAKLREKNGGGV